MVSPKCSFVVSMQEDYTKVYSTIFCDWRKSSCKSLKGGQDWVVDLFLTPLMLSCSRREVSTITSLQPIYRRYTGSELASRKQDHWLTFQWNLSIWILLMQSKLRKLRPRGNKVTSIHRDPSKSRFQWEEIYLRQINL